MKPESKGDLVLIVDGNLVSETYRLFIVDELQKRGYWVLLIVLYAAEKPFAIQNLTSLEPADKQEIIYLVEKAMHVSV